MYYGSTVLNPALGRIESTSLAAQIYRTTGSPARRDESFNIFQHRWEFVISPQEKLLQLRKYLCGDHVFITLLFLPRDQSLCDTRYKLTVRNINHAHISKQLEKLEPLSRIHIVHRIGHRLPLTRRYFDPEYVRTDGRG